MIDPHTLDPNAVTSSGQPLPLNPVIQPNQPVSVAPPTPANSTQPDPVQPQLAQPSATMNPFDTNKSATINNDFLQSLHDLPGEEDTPSEKALGDQVMAPSPLEVQAQASPQGGTNLPPAIEHPEVNLAPNQPGPEVHLSPEVINPAISDTSTETSSHQEIEAKLDQLNQGLQVLHQKVDQLLQK